MPHASTPSGQNASIATRSARAHPGARVLTRLFALSAAAAIAAAPLSAAEAKPPAPAEQAPTTGAANNPADVVVTKSGRDVVITKDGREIKIEGGTVDMPAIQVTGTRLREIDVSIKRIEKQIKREKKALEKSNLDEALNSEKIARAAALFGGKSTVQRASVAAVRLESMEKELSLLETLRTPLTAEDRALIEQLIKDQRTYRRDLDLALR